MQYATIQAAVDAAESGDTIIVAPGIYRENIEVERKHVILESEGFRDDPNVIEQTIIEADNPLGTIVRVYGPETDGTQISGFTIQGGENGVYMSGGSKPIVGTIRDNRFSGNNIALLLAHGSYTVADNLFYGNGKFGGDGVIDIRAGAEIDVLVQGNEIRDNINIGIFVHRSSHTTSVVITENTIYYSGRVGIWAALAHDSSQLDILDNTIEGHEVGLRIHVTDGRATVALNRIIGNGGLHFIEENVHGSRGGGLHLGRPNTGSGTRSIFIDRNEFRDNAAGIAGGGLFLGEGNGNVRVTNNVFSLNEAVAAGGGGIFVNQYIVPNGPLTNAVDEDGVPITLAPGEEIDSGGNEYKDNSPDDLRRGNLGSS